MIVVVFFMRKCTGVTITPSDRIEIITTHYDTIIKEVVKEYHTTDFKPQIIYIDTNTLKEVKDTSKGFKINKYNDTINDTNFSLFSEYLVDGKLLSVSNKYNLKLPEITKTVTIEYRPKSLNELFLTSTIGGNKEQFNNLSAGLLFKHKKGWLTGYNYNVINNTHNITIGTRLLKK
jgi:hypothetical protein